MIINTATNFLPQIIKIIAQRTQSTQRIVVFNLSAYRRIRVISAIRGQQPACR